MYPLTDHILYKSNVQRTSPEHRAERLCSRSFSSLSTWRGTWRSTYFGTPAAQRPQIDCTGLYSDVLHRPFLCSVTLLLPYASNIPARNAIPKLSNIPSIEFTQDWTDVPFILTEPVRDWPVYREWSTDTMLNQYGNIRFRAEAVDWCLKTYVDYMTDHRDESPLYLFDRSFVEKMDLKVGRGGQYWSPECFGEDLFAVLGAQRPNSRWLIVGPERSGSTFHKDPNATRSVNNIALSSHFH